jgi:hypothetical protein
MERTIKKPPHLRGLFYGAPVMARSVWTGAGRKVQSGSSFPSLSDIPEWLAEKASAAFQAEEHIV